MILKQRGMQTSRKGQLLQYFIERGLAKVKYIYFLTDILASYNVMLIRCNLIV